MNGEYRYSSIASNILFVISLASQLQGLICRMSNVMNGEYRYSSNVQQRHIFQLVLRQLQTSNHLPYDGKTALHSLVIKVCKHQD